MIYPSLRNNSGSWQPKTFHSSTVHAPVANHQMSTIGGPELNRFEQVSRLPGPCTGGGAELCVVGPSASSIMVTWGTVPSGNRITDGWIDTAEKLPSNNFYGRK